MTVAVTGATGQQGGSVVEACLKAGFKVRAITRNVESEKAAALKAKGCEVVAASFDDVSALTAAFKGCEQAFLMTNYWELLFSGLSDVEAADKELEHIKNMGEACVAADIKHAVLSTLEDTRKLDYKSMLTPFGDSDLKVPHFDRKAEGLDILKAMGVPVTGLITNFYANNLLTYFPPKVTPDGSYAFGFSTPADEKLRVYDVDDTGLYVAPIFTKGPAEMAMNTVHVAADMITPTEIAAVLSKVTGLKIAFNYFPPDVFAGFGFPGAGDLANMFKFWTSYPAYNAQAHDPANYPDGKHPFAPEAKTFEQWAEKNKDAIKSTAESSKQ